MDHRNQSFASSSAAGNRSNPPSSMNGSQRSVYSAHRTDAAAAAAKKAADAAAAAAKKTADEIAANQYYFLQQQSENCRVQRFLKGDMDEVGEELPFRLEIMEKREFIEELGVDSLAFALRVEQLICLEKLEKHKKKLLAREAQARVRHQRRAYKSTTAYHSHGFRHRNNRRPRYIKNEDDEETHEIYEILPDIIDLDDDRSVIHNEQRRLETAGVVSGGRRRTVLDEDRPSAQQIAKDSLRSRMRESNTLFCITTRDGTKRGDRRTVSTAVLHVLHNTNKKKGGEPIPQVIRSKGDLISPEIRSQFLDQLRKQDERRRQKAKNVEDKLARAQLAELEGAEAPKIKPQDIDDWLPDETAESLLNFGGKKPSSRAGSLNTVKSSKKASVIADEDDDDASTVAGDDGIQFIELAGHRVRVRKVPVPKAALQQHRSNRAANARAQKLIDEVSSSDSSDDNVSIGSGDDANEELHAYNNVDDSDDYDDCDETGVRDLDAFYRRRYGLDLKKSERYYNVYMRKLFELQPNEVYDGTALLLRKATLNRIDDRGKPIYTDADIRRDISCGLFPGGVRVRCEPDEDLSELRAIVYTEYIEFAPHTSKLVPKEMHCRCGICDCRRSCDGCACQKDACKCKDKASKCPHKESFRFGCKRSKRCIYNAQVARNNNYLAPIDKHGAVSWSSILAEGAAAGDQVDVADEDVSTQLYEYLVMVCGPRCACSCAETMPIGYGPNPELSGAFELRKTPECGWGVFTTRALKKGTYLFEYAGEVVSSSYIEKRKRQSHYVFDVPIADEMVKNMGGQEILCVDAIDMGNLSRFVNHSCVENCIARRVFIGHTHSAMSRLVYFTRMDIAADVELTLDYQWDWWVHMNKKYGFTCKCGEEKCKYTVELMPGVREAHRLERGEDDDDEDDSDEEGMSQNSGTVKPEAEIEAEAAAAAVNDEEDGLEFLSERAFEAVLGIASGSKNVIRRDAGKKADDEDAIEIALLNASTRQAKKTIDRNRRDMKMMTMTTIPENPTEIVLDAPQENVVEAAAAVDGADQVWFDDEIDEIMDEPANVVLAPEIAAVVVEPVAVAAAQVDVVDVEGGEAGSGAAAAPAAPVDAPAPAPPEADEKKEESDAPAAAAVASSSSSAAAPSMVERVFEQVGRKARNEFRDNIMNILHAPLPIRNHLDNLLESLCATTNRISLYAEGGYDVDEFEDKKDDQKKEEKVEPRSVFDDGSPSAMALFIGNDADMLQEEDKMKTEPIPVMQMIGDDDADQQQNQVEIIDVDVQQQGFEGGDMGQM